VISKAIFLGPKRLVRQYIKLPMNQFCKCCLLALRAIEGAKKVSAPLGRQDFHCPPLQLGRVMGFPS
jgi:hypothetical protein